MRRLEGGGGFALNGNESGKERHGQNEIDRGTSSHDQCASAK